MKKRLLSILLTACLLAGLLPTAAALTPAVTARLWLTKAAAVRAACVLL